MRYDFDAGLPDPACYPIEDLRRYFDAVLREVGPAVLNYVSGSGTKDMVYGHYGLRDALAQWLGEHESINLSPDEVLLANGSMNGLSMTVNALIGPGDAAIVEAVSYAYTRRFIEVAGGKAFTVPVDEHGMDVAQVAARLAEAHAAGLRPRLVYTISTFHSPTGTVLTLDRRRRLLELAREWGVTILDDNCYYHLHYDEHPPPSLLSIANGCPVVQSGSFSKYVAPGLRMAWLAGPADLIATIAGRRQDFAVSQLTAQVLERYIRDGRLDQHLDELRSIYRSKRDVAAAALTKHCSPWVRFRPPSGGIYFWLQIDERVDYELAIERAAALGVSFRPGVRFMNAETGTRALRLSVSQMPEHEIESGIALLGQALNSAVVVHDSAAT